MHFLGELVALVAACAVIAYLCQRLRILPIVGFLVAGVVIGPNALGLVTEAALIESIAELGIVLLLFTLGIEFSLERLWRIRNVIFVAGTLQVVLTIAVVTAILMAFGVEVRSGIFTGALIALSSTAIVLKVLDERAETASEKGQLSVGILIFQDLAIVALVLLAPMLAGQTTSAIEIGAALLKAVAIVVAIVAVARRGMPFILEQVARTCAPEIFLLTIVAICLGTAWLTNLVGVSLSLGAFLAGLIVSESRFSHHAFGEILPLQMLFSAAFFVSVGMLLDVRFMLRHPLLLIAVVVAVCLLKAITTAGSALIAGRRLSVSLAVGVLLAQIGEFSFVLQRTGASLGLHPAGVSGMGEQMFIAASVLLMVMTPFLGKVARDFEKHAPAQPQENQTEDEVAEQPIELANHVIIAGYGVFARSLARVLRHSGVPFVILTLSPTGATEAEGEGARVVRGNYGRAHLLEQANIAAAKMLVIPDDEPEMVRRVTAVARSLNPDLHIVARTAFQTEIDTIIGDGANEVIADEQEVTVQLFTRVLTEYEIDRDEIDEHVQTVRAGGYAALRVPEEQAPQIRCRSLPPAGRTITLTPQQRDDARCEHVRQVRAEIVSSAVGCEDCLRLGQKWVHLRICMTCGGVRCCDSSPNRHATKHHHASGHPVIRSYEPGELWAWCYPDELTL